MTLNLDGAEERYVAVLNAGIYEKYASDPDYYINTPDEISQGMSRVIARALEKTSGQLFDKKGCVSLETGRLLHRGGVDRLILYLDGTLRDYTALPEIVKPVSYVQFEAFLTYSVFFSGFITKSCETIPCDDTGEFSTDSPMVFVDEDAFAGSVVEDLQVDGFLDTDGRRRKYVHYIDWFETEMGKKGRSLITRQTAFIANKLPIENQTEEDYEVANKIRWLDNECRWSSILENRLRI